MGQNNTDKETKHSESFEWSKNTELERCTGDRVTVPLNFEKEHPGESMVKNRRAARTKPEGVKGSACVVFVSLYWCWCLQLGNETEIFDPILDFLY